MKNQKAVSTIFIASVAFATVLLCGQSSEDAEAQEQARYAVKHSIVESVAFNNDIDANDDCLDFATLTLTGRYNEVTENMDNNGGVCGRNLVKLYRQGK